MPACLALVTAVSISASVCSFFEPIEHRLAAAFDAEHQRAAVRLGHRREQMLRGRIDAAFAAPLDRDAAVVDPRADRLDALGLQQEMIVDEVDRAVALLLQLLELVRPRAAGCASATCLR